MNPESPFSPDRRSFVKKSLATSVTISFAGLIRAHGEEKGGTTTEPEATMVLTTAFETTNGPTYPETTVDPWGTVVTTVPETTCFETTCSMAVETTRVKPFYLLCVASPTKLELQNAANFSIDLRQNIPYGPFHYMSRCKKDKLEVPGPRRGDFSPINPQPGNTKEPMPPIVAIHTTIFQWQEWNANGGWGPTTELSEVVRKATETQIIVGDCNGTISFLAGPTVHDSLKDASGGSGGINDSVVDGRVAILSGNVEAASAWADGVGSAGTGLSFSDFGFNFGDSPPQGVMKWQYKSLEWGLSHMKNYVQFLSHGFRTITTKSQIDWTVCQIT